MLSREQAEWLITFFHNVPGVNRGFPQVAVGAGEAEHISRDTGYDYECYPVVREEDRYPQY